MVVGREEQVPYRSRVPFWSDETIIVTAVAQAEAWCGGGHGSHTADETHCMECAIPHVDL